ncbi:hypothetical protein FPZ12_003475 [Amycolatopsis acidicola]|uniref:Acyl-CoA dehydrogenase/oxidase C-terminal domain-containing protein n=1 Tax=Amycolatopsis acidicola TaxID=2596893 RepID=A0A5N0VL09_9PSEU|nr:acyl-CoA dehydrogenase family protein [Amycolatopsis acidicola]KAA9166024.1 hypothetical protein FPZ12_003475 [Amycolatopsis acidicola]
MSLAATALAAEQLGGAQACLDASASYARERVQFGRAIGSFQAVKHRIADDLVEVELARVLVEAAVASICAGEDSGLPASLAKVAAATAYQRLAADNIQNHGGIGYTWEHDAHLYFRRAFGTAPLFGDVDELRDLIAAEVM